jgi:TetR/AcrR family acrAB operon transcriptional repressor
VREERCGMARKTREEAKETRERLLESALEIMSEKPFSRVSMNEIAEKIGLSKGAVYWHFKNKNDLLINLVESLCREGEEEFLADGVDFESWNDLRLYFRDKMDKAAQSGRYKRINMLMQREVEWPEAVREKIFTMGRTWIETERKMVVRVLEKLQRDGTLRSDSSADDLAAIITAVFHGLMISRIFDFFSIDLTKQTDFIFDAFTEHLRPEKTDIQKEKVRLGYVVSGK